MYINIKFSKPKIISILFPELDTIENTIDRRLKVKAKRLCFLYKLQNYNFIVDFFTFLKD